jgi:diguanylate cyclase (GGDEF)-like protein
MDFTGRWGGEEFLVLWYDIDASAVERLAESCRLLIECLHPPHGRITASGGCAILLPGLESMPYELIERADAALYRAKQTGRNRIVMAQAPAAGIRWRA